MTFRFETKKLQNRQSYLRELIQKCFCEQLELIVDQLKQVDRIMNGENKAISFSDSFQCNGVDKDLRRKFHIILVIFSGFELQIEKVNLHTPKPFIKLCSWFYMVTTIYEIVIYNHLIIHSPLLSID